MVLGIKMPGFLGKKWRLPVVGSLSTGAILLLMLVAYNRNIRGFKTSMIGQQITKVLRAVGMEGRL